MGDESRVTQAIRLVRNCSTAELKTLKRDLETASGDYKRVENE
jgi:hypothetical protein